MRLYGIWETNSQSLQDARRTEQHTARTAQLHDAIRELIEADRLTDLVDFLDDHPSYYVGAVLMDWLKDGAPQDGEDGHYWSDYWRDSRFG